MAKFTKFNNPSKKRRHSDGCGYGPGFYGLSRDQYIDSLVKISLEKGGEKSGAERKDS